jgi:hypothetical protein
MYRLYLARERLRDGIVLQNEPSPLARMRGILALDDAVELVVITLLQLLSIPSPKDQSLAGLLGPLVKERPALGSHNLPVTRLRRLRDRVKHDGVVPSAEELRLNAVEAESFVRAALVEVTGLTLEQVSPLEAIEDGELKALLVAGATKLDAGDYLGATIEASQAFAMGRRRFEFAMEIARRDRDVSRTTLDALIAFLSHAAARAGAKSSDSTVASFGRRLGDALKEERSFARNLFEDLARPTKLAALGIDLVEFEQFERLTPHVLVQDRGEWCRVSLLRPFTPNKVDAFFVFDFAARALLSMQDRLARRASEGTQPGG